MASVKAEMRKPFERRPDQWGSMAGAGTGWVGRRRMGTDTGTGIPGVHRMLLARSEADLGRLRLPKASRVDYCLSTRVGPWSGRPGLAGRSLAENAVVGGHGWIL